VSPPPDPPRPRLMTRPPAPPSSIEDRVRDLEHGHGALSGGLESVKDEVTKAVDALRDIQNTLLVFSTEKTATEKRKDTWMKWVVGVAVGVTVTALGTLAAWVIHLQTAMGR
jgi:hypothetical protein